MNGESRAPEPVLWHRLPLAAWLVALAAAAFHMFPYWRAELATPPGWTFTGNITVSPDYMQYRVWARQTQRDGPIVDNRFTTEPNRPHLIVPFYWVVGGLARWTGATPEATYWYLGTLFAAALALMLFATARHFLPDPHQHWWVFLATLAGGGLGAHLKILAETSLRHSFVFSRVIGEPIRQWPLFENYRSHYVVKTLQDTHFLLIWIATLGAVLAMHAALRRASALRLVAVAVLSAIATLLHVYEGVTLVAIAGGIWLCCRLKGIEARRALVVFVWCTVAVAAVYVWWIALYRAAGIPMPDWRAVMILVSILLLAYPLAWPIIAWGGRRFWLGTGLDGCVLLGWALGCTVVTLSGPFYPYPDRGTMTMQVPLTILAGAIWFAVWPRLSWRAATVALVVLSGTPAWLVAFTVKLGGFHEDAPWKHVNAAHVAVIDSLERHAAPHDVLLVEGRDALWLMPTYPGRAYVGHFFLTVDFKRKTAELERFLTTAAQEEQRAFLAGARARWLFVNADRDPARFATVPGLTAVARQPVGWLFEFHGAATR